MKVGAQLCYLQVVETAHVYLSQKPCEWARALIYWLIYSSLRLFHSAVIIPEVRTGRFVTKKTSNCYDKIASIN